MSFVCSSFGLSVATSSIEVATEDCRMKAFRDTTGMLNNAYALDGQQSDQYQQLREQPVASVPTWEKPDLADFE
ncbi:hypothetical protein [Comamonas thiooxydans]|uniref:Uncharacterized protein n=1 Tax=Comamonas thiooxydans TaxID=363952 RepID=A0A0E3BGJ8_9BURK|nr:hypothetical protein [Comamonas thiooxydans]KGG87659.1 hypothetical protein P245_19600 [Comamonas thiooxydans]KGH22993.1 hypothetical protein P606_13245 [Comamonas thiooxydans]